MNNIANYVQTLPNLKAFIDLRSYGQMCTSSARRLLSAVVDGLWSTVSIPFSWSCKNTPKYAEDLLEAALGAANAIKQAHGSVFTVRNPYSFPLLSLTLEGRADRQPLRTALQGFWQCC